MPSTYTPTDAMSLVQNLAHGIPVSANQAVICDMVHSLMWNFYPWRWTIASLTPITCTNGVQDYTPTNADILRPLKLRLARTDISPNEFREMALLANLAPELTRRGGLETITSVGWYPSGPFFRLLYATQISAPQVLQIQGEYQQTPPKITNATMGNPFLFPDHFFETFIEGVTWKIYQLSDDARSGSMQYTKNGNMVRAYTGQFGIFMDSLLAMARTEDLAAGDEFQFPEQPLGVGRSYWPGLYGV